MRRKDIDPRVDGDHYVGDHAPNYGGTVTIIHSVADEDTEREEQSMY